MFTGIVQRVGVVESAAEAGNVTALAVRIGDLAADLEPGASVAVDGTCLTTVAIAAGAVRFDVIAETRAATNLGRLQSGDRVNVERSLRFGDEVGGHVLSGHISAAATVVALARTPGHCRLTVSVPEKWMRYLMPKGFVALNGTSLTIQELDQAHGTIDVSLIPETLDRTTFDATNVGDRLNLEVDTQTQAVVETVHRLLPTFLAASQTPPGALAAATATQ